MNDKDQIKYDRKMREKNFSVVGKATFVNGKLILPQVRRVSIWDGMY